MSDQQLDAAWQETAKALLRIQMLKNGMNYATLAEALGKWGIEENERNLRNKIARGTFSAAFFLECLVAMGCPDLRFEGERFPAPEGERKLVSSS